MPAQIRNSLRSTSPVKLSVILLSLSFAGKGLPADFVLSDGSSFHGEFLFLRGGVVHFVKPNQFGLEKEEKLFTNVLRSLTFSTGVMLDLSRSSLSLEQAKIFHDAVSAEGLSTFYMKGGKVRKGELFMDREDSLVIIARVRGMDKRMTYAKNRFYRVQLPDGSELDLGEYAAKMPAAEPEKQEKEKQGKVQVRVQPSETVNLETRSVHLSERLQELEHYLAFEVLQESGSRAKVALLPFVEEGMVPEGSGTAVANWLAFYLRFDPNVKLLEYYLYRRGMEGAVLKNGAPFDNGMIPDFGRSMGADWVLSGVVRDTGQDVEIRAVLHQIETQNPYGAVQISAPSAAVERLGMKPFVVNVDGGSAFWRSLTFPGWGQIHSGSPVRGTLYALVALVGAGALGWTALELSSREDDLDGFESKPVVRDGDTPEQLRKRYSTVLKDRNEASERVNLVATGLAGYWALQSLDAWLTGWLFHEEATKKYFVSLQLPQGENLSFAVQRIWSF